MRRSKAQVATSSYGELLKFNEKYIEYIGKTKSSYLNYLVGAYRSSKSVFNALSFGLYILDNDIDALYLVCASTASSAKTIVQDGSGFGLKHFFAERYREGKYNGLDAGYVQTDNGEAIIVYVGGSVSSSFESFRGWSVEGVLIEEGDLLHENTLNELKGRTFAAKNPKYFVSHNPCSKKKPIVQWREELTNGNPDKVNFMRVSIYDNPGLSDERKADIVGQYDPNSIFFKRMIMGEDCAAEGVIYSLQPDNLIDDTSPVNYKDYIVVVDPGKTASATSMLAVGRNVINKSLDVTHELHHKNDTNMARNYISSDYARLSIQFIKDVANYYNKWPSAIVIDSYKGDDFYENLIKEVRAQGLHLTVKFPVRTDGKDGKDKKSDMITRELDLFYRLKLRINKKCTFIIDDLMNATYDQKQLEKGIETRTENFNAEGHADSLDCLDYAVSFYGPILNSMRW